MVQNLTVRSLSTEKGVMGSQYYEKGEYHVKERQTVNGVSREWEDAKEWSRGEPIGRLQYEKNTVPLRIEPGREWFERKIPRDFMDWEQKDPWASRFALPECFPSRGRPSSRSSIKFPVEEVQEIRRSKSVDRNIHDSRSRAGSAASFYPSSRQSREAPPYYSIQKSPTPSYASSRPDYRHVQNDPVSRPGSPGPVAGAGDILNTEHGFTIQLDVKHFRPEDIKVVLTGDTLTVTGERSEDAGSGQTLRRSFQRKYSIPTDIKLDSVASHLANGFLVVTGSRKGWRETQISVHPADHYYRGSQVISNV